MSSSRNIAIPLALAPAPALPLALALDLALALALALSLALALTPTPAPSHSPNPSPNPSPRHACYTRLRSHNDCYRTRPLNRYAKHRGAATAARGAGSSSEHRSRCVT